MHDDRPARILLVEDDPALAQRVKDFLEKHGSSTRIETRANTACARLRSECFDLAILDWMLPDGDGLDVCRRIKAHLAIPVLMLTARDGDQHEVLALNAGADDYLAKPVRPAVLLARVRALLRRSHVSAPNTPTLTTFVNGSLTIVMDQRVVTMSGMPIDLTTAEYELLSLLATNVGRVLSRDELYLALRGTTHDGLDRSLDLRIVRIRKKLGDETTANQLIKTVRCVGYMMARQR